jgi:organic radical activating enzyme
MKTIQFEPLDERRKVTNNVEVYDVVKFEINSKVYKVYSNCNLIIFVNKFCNAKCKFCINTFNNSFNKSSILSKDKYLNKIEEILIKLKSLNPTVSIDGGEPTKSDLLAPLLRLIKKYSYRGRTFHTNGTGLFDIYEDVPQIDHLIKEGFKSINLNVTHYNEKINNQIMNYKDDGLSNDQIKTIAYYAKANDMYLRMSCVLHKNGIATLDNMINYFNFYNDLGIDNSLFREQIRIKNDEYLSTFVDIDQIVKTIENDKRFTFLRKLEGLHYIVKVYKYLENNNEHLVKIYDEKKIDDDIVKDLILYPNGELSINFNFENEEC